MLQFATPWGTPYDFASYATPRAADVVAGTLYLRSTTTLCYGSPRLCYADAIEHLKQRFPTPRYFIDLVDSPVPALRAQEFVVSHLHRMDLWKTKRWESNLCRQHEAIYVSPVDARAAGDHPAIVSPMASRPAIMLSARRAHRVPSRASASWATWSYRPNIEALCRPDAVSARIPQAGWYTT